MNRIFSFGPLYEATYNHSKATRGESFARPITGTIEDVQKLTPESLRKFHKRNYRLGNAILVFCSAESTERQREIALDLMDDYFEEGEDQPVYVEFENFNPENLTSSLQKVDLPIESQFTICIGYDLPETSSTRKCFEYGLVNAMLNKAAHNRLRRELALCYGANSELTILQNFNFGQSDSWAVITPQARINGEDAVAGLDALYKDVLLTPFSEKDLETIKKIQKRTMDLTMESNPSIVADRVANNLNGFERDEIDFNEANNFVQSLTIESVRKIQKSVTDTKPLILATSPDQTVLERVGEWAESNIV